MEALYVAVWLDRYIQRFYSCLFIVHLSE